MYISESPIEPSASKMRSTTGKIVNLTAGMCRYHMNLSSHTGLMHTGKSACGKALPSMQPHFFVSIQLEMKLYCGHYNTTVPDVKQAIPI